jgi:hypothetical protein
MKIPTTGRQYPKLVKEVAIPFNYTANGVNAKASTKKGVLTTTIPLPAEQESSSSGVEALRATRTLPPRPTKLRRVKLHPARALFVRVKPKAGAPGARPTTVVHVSKERLAHT